MLWNLGSGWLFLAVVSVGILSFIVAMALNAILGSEGFGATGNAIIVTAGFFFSIYTVNMLGYRLDDIRLAMFAGLGGAGFALLTLLALKAALARW